MRHDSIWPGTWGSMWNKQKSGGAGITERRSQDGECLNSVLGFVPELLPVANA